MLNEELSSALTLGFARAAIEGAVRNLRRLSGGASQETWAFDLERRDGQSPLILRRAPGGAASAGDGFAGIGLATEAKVIQSVRAAGVSAPEVVLELSAEDGAGEGYVMACIAGEALPRRILRDEAFSDVRPHLAAQCGRELARIHATPIDGLSRLSLPRLDGPTQLARYRDIYDRYDQPKPMFELAFSWLADHMRPVERPVLVHGDFRHGNLMIDPTAGLAATLDWELAHLGDPAEDLGWLCVNSWRFGVPERRVGGFGDLHQLLDAYAGAGGAVISPDDIQVWEVFGTLKWGIGCTSMYEAFRSGFDRSVERAAIGRRASECEIDLANLLLGDVA